MPPKWPAALPSMPLRVVFLLLKNKFLTSDYPSLVLATF